MASKRKDPTVTIQTSFDQSNVKVTLFVRPNTPKEQRIVVGPKPVIIGNGMDVDVNLADPYVSGEHTEIKRTPRGVQVRDLGSRNGTLVQGIAVAGALLDQSATLIVGQTTMRLEIEGTWTASGQSASDVGRFGDSVGMSQRMRDVFGVVERLAPTDLTITVLGETGTGKDVLARAIHGNSSRRDRPFVVFDCGAAAPSLIESQLFGHVRGSFTGAVADHKGAFERADTGTLFLDEIGELALDLQPKLLRALEQQRIHRIGAQTDTDVNVRIIAATHKELQREVDEGRFRQDLFFRLNAAVVRLPPLRDRLEDIPTLAKQFAAEHGDFAISPDAMIALKSHKWPGNIRELKNSVAGAVAIADGPVLQVPDFLAFRQMQREPDLERLTLAGHTLESIERAAILQSLQQCGGNKTRAAKMLGIATSTLYEKLKKIRTS